MGIDPGYERVGFAIIEKQEKIWKAITWGCLKTAKEKNFSERLREINEELGFLIKKYQPTIAAVEELYVCKNLKTAIKVGEARGVILLTLCQAGVPCEEFTPLQVKLSVAGYGSAKKEQVQNMVKMSLRLKKIPQPDDAADALAIALTLTSRLSFKRIIKNLCVKKS